MSIINVREASHEKKWTTGFIRVGEDIVMIKEVGLSTQPSLRLCLSWHMSNDIYNTKPFL